MSTHWAPKAHEKATKGGFGGGGA